jgi:DNA-binding response OmpR family regulator
MHLLLIEDDESIARELSLLLPRAGWSVTHCDRLGRIDADVDMSHVDVVVLDLQLPDGDGIDWLRRLREGGVLVPVIILTARDSVADRVSGLKIGADDYLVKPFAIDELLARLEVIWRRRGQQSEQRAQCGDLLWLGSEGRVLLKGKVLELHPREFEVLGLLMRRSPRLVARRFLLECLAERNLDVGDSAVEVYISRLRKRLSESSVHIETVRGFGYRLVPANAAA